MVNEVTLDYNLQLYDKQVEFLRAQEKRPLIRQAAHPPSFDAYSNLETPTI
jgi:hypothetical protein